MKKAGYGTPFAAAIVGAAATIGPIIPPSIPVMIYASMAEVKKGLASYFQFYNEKRWHNNFDRKTPAMVYFNP